MVEPSSRVRTVTYADHEIQYKQHWGVHTFGPEVSPLCAPGVIPRLAFHRAKLSSSASSWAYSSAVFSGPVAL